MKNDFYPWSWIETYPDLIWDELKGGVEIGE